MTLPCNCRARAHYGRIEVRPRSGVKSPKSLISLHRGRSIAVASRRIEVQRKSLIFLHRGAASRSPFPKGKEGEARPAASPSYRS
jgi:hypothetical protein